MSLYRNFYLIIFIIGAVFTAFTSSTCLADGVTINKPKIAFITAIYGGYESSCRNVVKQTLDSDFICFTDAPLISVDSDLWVVDRTPYHIVNKSKIDNGSYFNSMKNNTTPFNVAKYYKEQWHLIPRLKDYDMVVWLDGTIEITNENAAKMLYDNISNDIITWAHEPNRTLDSERIASKFPRYDGQKIDEQYKFYLDQGYDDSHFKKVNNGTSVWVTCMVAFANNSRVHTFLDHWYLQNLEYSTQDQIGFPYSLWVNNIKPLTLASGKIKGSFHNSTIHHKHGHHAVKPLRIYKNLLMSLAGYAK